MLKYEHEIASWAVDGVNRGLGHHEWEPFVSNLVSSGRVTGQSQGS